MRIKLKIAAILLSILFFLSSCIYNFAEIDGNGTIVSIEKEIGEIEELEINGAFDIVLIPGTEGKVRVEADENLMDYILVWEQAGRLIIESDANLDPSRDIIIHIPIDQLKYMELSGAVDLSCQDILHLADIEIECSGASDCELRLEANNCMMDISGASDISIEGEAQRFTFDASGASELDADDFVVKHCVLDLSGASEADVYVTETLEIDASGAAHVRYRGGAKILNQDISGAASVKSY